MFLLCRLCRCRLSQQCRGYLSPGTQSVCIGLQSWPACCCFVASFAELALIFLGMNIDMFGNAQQWTVIEELDSIYLFILQFCCPDQHSSLKPGQ